MLTIQTDHYLLHFQDEHMYTAHSTDNKTVYMHEYLLSDPATSAHGVVCQTPDTRRWSCILLASGGGTTIHAHSAVVRDDVCIIAIGNTIAALQLPQLDLTWHRIVDTATCFGVYFSQKHQCLIIHGECEIVRLTTTGTTVWQYSGRDIFTGRFHLHDDIIEVADFNDDPYLIDIDTGYGWLIE